MTDLVGEAGAALAPLLAAGGGAVAAKMAEDLGKDAAGVAERVVRKLRARLKGRHPGQAQIEAALNDALRNGEVTEADLRILVESRTSNMTLNQNPGPSINIGSVSGGNVGNTYNIQGDFHGSG